MGLSPYLLMVDSESGAFEAVRSPRDSGNGSGMQMVAMIIAVKCDVLLARWCSPTVEKYLSAHGVGIVTGMSGTVAEVIAGFERENLKGRVGNLADRTPSAWRPDQRAAMQALRSASRQILNLLPAMIGVIFLTGLFMTFVSAESLMRLFSGGKGWDAFWGACLGSLFAGNPINSYIIGGQLLEMGVSLFAVTALICSWVSVGVLQMPAEIAALGWRFTVLRNASCFVLSMGVSFGVAVLLKVFEV
ncbi:MAG: NifB/NifX family molybdenum-iron cluster-binding protein [Deltaproteobacteria bacterium]|nr:NifB/NifX family molybdenum-iron cluster-binding protein [Deltaproteobacteria bacterium]